MPSFALLFALVLAAGPKAAPRLEAAQPWLGIQLDEAEGGVGIGMIFAGSPAEAAGLKAGDLVKSIDGTKMTSPPQLVRAVKAAGIGATIKVRFVRGDTPEQTASIRLAVRPDLEDMQKRHLVGRAAPDFEVRKANLVAPARLQALRGSVVLLDFWAPWCGPCVAALPHLQALHEKWTKKGLKVLGVSSDEFEKVAAMARRKGLTYPQIADENGAIGTRYVVTSLPTMVLIDQKGRVAEVSIGDRSAIERAIEALLP